MTNSIDADMMKHALRLAQTAASLGEVPVGAVITCDQAIIAGSHNLKESVQNPMGHAEILAIQQASAQKDVWRLSDCTLYVTLEPCLMCVGAIIQSRIGRVVYGATDPKAGAIESVYTIFSDGKLNHKPRVTGGVLEAECSDLLKQFFKNLRAEKGIKI